MANKNISDLPSATTMSGADLHEIQQGGVNKQATASLFPVSTAQAAAIAACLQAPNNLSDLASPSTARANLGLNATATSACLVVGNNLSDLNSVATARSNLGLGGAAVLSVGIGSNTVAAGNDSRIVAAVPNTVTVNGHALSSNVTVTASDIGLGNCNNTSDVNKPVSTAQATAIAACRQIVSTLIPLTYAGSNAIDFTKPFQTISPTGTLTLTSANLPASGNVATVDLWIACDTVNHTLTVPVGWIGVGGTIPTIIGAGGGTYVRLKLTALGNSDTLVQVEFTGF